MKTESILSSVLIVLAYIQHASAFNLRRMRSESFRGILMQQRSQQQNDSCTPHGSIQRRDFMGAIATGFATTLIAPGLALAEKPTLDGYLYKVVRVREATQQEKRLIKSGKFKDVQRANVKLAVKFMIQNYRLADSVVGASAYLPGNDKQIKAIDVGQTAVQNLQTILEYFDSADVQNIKVGENSIAGKEALVLKGLDAAQAKLDEFLSFFPEDTVASIKKQVNDENDLNMQEFDSNLGNIVNMAVQK
mmetsp:Transcript_13860/g.38086  ORF Transcript_13860/g.38086 Transcript_13860/m.38086 type:complete len:248 (-) Transcript_13860:1060-1803(-)|eukprot:CAMPEP_0198135386 /NCGR_PEP_ID=MMETSP1442-20131203/60564_1 /TAXON_ID= /ORGANISM="Craspedostauros australis, Strain CCMP3328" /LENGTH=247 /DNA_ID=CAMNT_0043796553 /DNA_START=166 /DNA_END=909 /DNA_ORIENTATION=+